MKSIAKNIIANLPIFLQRFIYKSYCQYYTYKYKGSASVSISSRQPNEKIKVLFYHISGLSFGGTEKSLQILAKYLDKEKYEVYFMYSPKPRNSGTVNDARIPYLNENNITLIPFDYKLLESKYPFFIHDMSPHINTIIEHEKVDIIVSAGTGYPEYPLNTIKNLPIVYLNIFGAPNLQDNFVINLCISHDVAKKAVYLAPKEKIEVMYIQSERPKSYEAEAINLRNSFGIKNTDTLFGRIGRASDEIFDPIGIFAFEKVTAGRDDVHYLIMSAPPILEKIVNERSIRNVHFLPPSGKESDVWTFHQAIDVLAHFRKDGESFGLNIAESMIVGNPIITHKTNLWNAQLEYLDESFARVAEQNDVEKYAKYMEEFAKIKKTDAFTKMQEASKAKAETLFLIENNIERFSRLIKAAIAK